MVPLKGPSCRAQAEGWLVFAEELDPLISRPWLEPHAQTPAAHAGTHQSRPLIYVYDLPSIYNTRLLQYRVVKVRL